MLWAMALLLTNHHFFRAHVLITLNSPRERDYKSISNKTLVVPRYELCHFAAHPKNFKYTKKTKSGESDFHQCVCVCVCVCTSPGPSDKGSHTQETEMIICFIIRVCDCSWDYP